ncbi:MAG: hypothetical protein VYA30_06705 [Myxococcota bacterium]|nr:hypothetical protein [Myxococcota bacterium]
MNTLIGHIGRFFLAMACAIALGACSDETPGQPVTGTGGTGGVGGMGASGGTGGDAGDGGGGGDMLCVNNGQCPEGQYCELDGGRVGNCLPGCRDDEECGDGQVCNPDSHMCEDEPCEIDSDCPGSDQYCNDGACVEGCRSTEESCNELDEVGRSSICDLDTRLCVPLYACCTGVDMCQVELQATCEANGGVALEGAADCSSNPCGVECVEDSDCGADVTRFCSVADGRCQDGCRLDEPGSCEDGQVCDPNSHQCIDLLCGSNNDCPDDRYCDLRDGRGLCLPGCRDDDGCDDGLSCNDNLCVRVCDPSDADACGEGQFCNPDTEQCEEACQEHADCEEGRFCDAQSGACLPGCRDDEGEGGEPNDTQATATVLTLDPPDANGRRYGSVEGRVLCDNNQDVIRIDVPAGARLRVDVTFDQGTPNFTLDGNSGNCGDDSNCAEALEWTCEDRVCVGPTQEARGRDQFAAIEYPAIGELVQDVASYYVTIAPTNQRITYRVDVVVVDAATGCIPDIRERAGDNNAGSATEIESGFADTIRGVICPEDEDWFRISLDPNDGLSMTLRSLDGTAIDAYFYPAGANRADPVLRAAEDSNRQDYPQGESSFVPGGDWFVVLTGRAPDESGAYELDVLHSPSVVDCGGGDQGDSVATGEAIDVEVDMETELTDLAICNADGADVDMFCFNVEADEMITAAAVMTGPDAQAGRLRIQVVNAQGEIVSNDAVNTVGDERLYARVIGTEQGQYCVRVEGINRSQGSYDLFVGRSGDMGGMCGLDFTENNGPRNDRASMATLLESDDGQYSFDEGYLCDPGVPDEDWYRFDIEQANSSVCVTVGGFSADRADIDVGIFPATGNAMGPNCTQGGQAFCDRSGGGACIPGAGGQFFCTPALEREATNYDSEVISIRRNIFRDREGEYLARIHHNDMNEGPYQLNITVIPPSDICEDDAYEPNNAVGDETFLGSGEVSVCDAWICEDEQINGDRYTIDVPAGQDRTVLVNYSDLVEGRLFMGAVDSALGEDAAVAGVESGILAGGNQCINIRGGAENKRVTLSVVQAERAPANDLGRTDYLLRVVPTDLANEPGGECVQLGAVDLSSAEFPNGVCPPRADWPVNDILGIAIQPNGCWPVLDL